MRHLIEFVLVCYMLVLVICLSIWTVAHRQEVIETMWLVNVQFLWDEHCVIYGGDPFTCKWVNSGELCKLKRISNKGKLI